MEKHKTIADVFIHNFETLNKWRELINVPHRLPEAVKYFVSQQLNNSEAIAGLMMEQPEHRVWNILAFTDRSVLVSPDEIYEDEASYNHVVNGTQVLEQIATIESELDQLSKSGNLTAFLDQAGEILKAFGVLRVKKSDFVAATITGLANELDSVLLKKFQGISGQKKFAPRLRAILEKADASGVLLKQCSELANHLQQSQKPKSSGTGPRAPRSRRTRAALKRRVGMQNTFPKIQFWFEKVQHVEHLNFSGLIEAFTPDRMTDIGVRQHCDSVQILFSGYANEQRSPFVIPELRTFLRALRKAWPHAPFFCDLDNSFLGLEAVAHLDHFQILERAGSPEFWFRIKTAELQQYVQESNRTIETLGCQAGMNPSEIRIRKVRFNDYITSRLGPPGKRG